MTGIKILIAGVIVFGLTGLVYYSVIARNNVITMKRAETNGVLIGDNNRVSNSAGADPINKVSKHIDYVSDHMMLGDQYLNLSRYSEAAEEYQKAYTGLLGELPVLTPGQSLAGGYLIETYEKLGRYDEALSLLDDLEKRAYKKETGEWRTEMAKNKCETIRARLLAAKAQADQKEPNPYEGVRSLHAT